jgi:hypothetical protein
LQPLHSDQPENQLSKHAQNPLSIFNCRHYALAVLIELFTIAGAPSGWSGERKIRVSRAATVPAEAQAYNFSVLGGITTVWKVRAQQRYKKFNHFLYRKVLKNCRAGECWRASTFYTFGARMIRDRVCRHMLHTHTQHTHAALAYFSARRFCTYMQKLSAPSARHDLRQPGNSVYLQMGGMCMHAAPR